MLTETQPYSREELRRRLIWCRDKKDPPLRQIANRICLDPKQLERFVREEEDLAQIWVRVLTDFFHKWDLGIWVSEDKRIVKSVNPRPRTNLTVNIMTGKIQIQTNPQLMGTANSWLPNALSRMEMLGSCENILASPTGRSRLTRSGVRKGAIR